MRTVVIKEASVLQVTKSNQNANRNWPFSQQTKGTGLTNTINNGSVLLRHLTKLTDNEKWG